MKRRKLLKSIGALGVIGIGSTLLSACNEVSKKETIQEKGEPTSTKNRQVMKMKYPTNPTKAELKHTPEINLGDTDPKGFTKIEITVGSKGIIHPTKKDHWIDYLELYKDGVLVGHLNIEPGMARGFSGFRVNLDGVKSLKAVIGCNIHGIWENTLML